MGRQSETEQSIECKVLEVEEKAKFKVGDKVKVKLSVETPAAGWGNVKHGDIGVVTNVDNGELPYSMAVAFPYYDHWLAAPDEMILASEKDISKAKKVKKPKVFEIGASVTLKSNSFGLAGQIGEVVKQSGEIMIIDFPNHKGYEVYICNVKLVPKSELKTTTATGKPRVKCILCERLRVRVIPYFWNEQPVCLACSKGELGRKMKNRFTRCSLTKRELQIDIAAMARREMAVIAKVDSDLLLFQAAADFYVLYDYHIDYPEKRGELEKLASYLAEQFKKYILYAIAGETRYHSWTIVKREEATKELVETLGRTKGEKIADWFSTHTHSRYNRKDIWEESSAITKSIGATNFTKACVILFGLPHWEGATGGRRWGVIAQTLLSYLEGQTNDIMFVDTAFGLKHNGNIHFDKVWSPEELEAVLNVNREGKTYLLRKLISEEVAKIIK